jgi:hypothetical protein
MLGLHKIIVDEWAEVWDLLKPYADASFWQWPGTFDARAFYIVGRVVLKENWQTITELADRYPGRIIFSNPAEGSETVLLQLKRLRIEKHVRDGRIGLLTSGDMEPGWHYCKTDGYFTNIVEYTENKEAALMAALTHKQTRPYDFLFLNGRLRPHRKYLIDALRIRSLLDQALWTNLSSRVELEFTSKLKTGKIESIRLLPPEYEIDRARENLKPSLYTDGGFVKHALFNNTWGDGIVNHRCYTDTWFSLVTETIYDYPYTFRTEKIWKPVLMSHPFIVAANRGYYHNLHRAGFCTFHSLVDESFDLIDCPQERLERIIAVVDDVCANGPDKFWSAAQSICKYNRERLVEYNQEQRSQLPNNLKTYLDARS